MFEVADDDDPENYVGAGYILLQKIRGNPMDWNKANDAQKDKICRQLADIYIQLDQHSLDRLGRLHAPSPASKLFEVGPTFLGYSSEGTVIPAGPFKCSNDSLYRHN